MFETAMPGAGYGYGYGAQQVGPQGPYGQAPQRLGGYPAGISQSVLPLTIGPGGVPFQQQQFGQPQFGPPQFGPPQFGPPQFGQQQFGLPQIGPQQFGQPQWGAQQLGPVQSQVQVIPVVTPQGWFGLLLLATGQPLIIGGTAGVSGGLGQQPAYGYGGQPGIMGGAQTGIGGLGGLGGPGGYLPLQAQQQIPQQIPFGATPFPGQPFGFMPIH
jgi:hypothetical protein